MKVMSSMMSFVWERSSTIVAVFPFGSWRFAQSIRLRGVPLVAICQLTFLLRCWMVVKDVGRGLLFGIRRTWDHKLVLAQRPPDPDKSPKQLGLVSEAGVIERLFEFRGGELLNGAFGELDILLECLPSDFRVILSCFNPGLLKVAECLHLSFLKGGDSLALFIDFRLGLLVGESLRA